MSAVTVVVLTHARRVEAQRTVERLLALPEAPPVIVVDNASADGTPAAIRSRFPSVRVLAMPVNLGAAARNAGVRAARTEHVALCNDDTWWAPGSLARAAAMLDAYPRLAVRDGSRSGGARRAGRPDVHAHGDEPARSRPGMPRPARAGLPRRRGRAPPVGVPRGGGFEPRFFLGGEEALVAIDLAARGWSLAYVADVVVHHHPSARRGPAAQRRRLLLRDALWCAWLRRSVPDALGRSLALMREHRGVRVSATLRALAGGPRRRSLTVSAPGPVPATRRRRAPGARPG